MREGQKGKFRVVIDKAWPKCFQVGIVLNHNEYETYLSLFLFKWTLSIGFIDRCEEDYE